MAIYHLSLKAIQRSKGRSATASAAYRSRAKIMDNRTGITYDYTRKKGVEGRAIFTPDGRQIDREELWNLAEAAERRKDGITAREYEIVLPSELDKDQRRELTAEFCRMLVSRYEVAADVAIYAPTPEGDQRNFHAHVQITTRTLKNGVLGAKSEFELSGTERKKRGLRSQKEELQDIRQEWERMVNASLERAGCPERVSCKSLADRGISRPPTVHLGVAATAMERKGIETERGDLNRWPLVRKLYLELREMKKNLHIIENGLSKIQQEKDRDNGRASGQRQESDARGLEKVYGTPAREDERGGSKTGYSSGSSENQEEHGGYRREDQGDKLANIRIEEAGGSTGKSKSEYPGSGRETGRDFEHPGKHIRDTGGVSGQREAGSVPGGPRRGGTAGKYGGANRADMGGRGEAGIPHWLERLKRLEEGIVRRLREYRTIGDRLAMNRGMEGEKQAQNEAEEAKKRPEGPK